MEPGQDGLIHGVERNRQLAEMQRQRRQLLPDDFPCDEARLAILQSQPETRVRKVF
jgi:hypothetical protein